MEIISKDPEENTVLFISNETGDVYSPVGKILETKAEAYPDACFRALSNSATFTIQADNNDFAHTLDLLCKPYIIYCHPDDEFILNTKEIKDSFIIRSTPACDKGKFVIVDRMKFEEEQLQNIKFKFEE